MIALSVGDVASRRTGAPEISTSARSGWIDSADSRSRVLLISMPWAPLEEPSLGLAILKARLAECGITCTVAHLNIFLLKYVKVESYERIGGIYAFNDFMFTQVFEGDNLASDQRAALAQMSTYHYGRKDLEVNAGETPSRVVEYALKVRNEAVPAFLADCMGLVERTPSTMIGFTCMYDQTIASLALASLIKRRYPDKLIVLGGYALENPCGPQIMRSFPFVDVVVFGEGEDRITSLAEASVDRGRLSTIPGIMYRDQDGEIHSTAPCASKVNLDESPVPDYDDFMADVERLNAEEMVEIAIQILPVESSRGCWWGEVSHCIFCGIDDETMRYRFKSPARVKEMLAELTRRYGCNYFRFSDYILPRTYYKTLLPELAEQERDKYLLHWEMKANVKHEEVALMSRAGVVALQPGIESFSTSVLKKMDKGVTGIQNVLTIKLLTEHGINAYYNILFGFPHDDPEEYRAMCERIPLLYHLPSPASYAQVLTTRYAPLQVDPERFGIRTPVVHEQLYEMIFSRHYRDQIGFDLDQYCYVFKTPYELPEDCKPYYAMLVYQVHHWATTQTERMVRLSYEVVDGGIEFRDSRFDPEERVVRFGRDHARVHEALAHSALSTDQLASVLAGEMSPEVVHGALGELDEERLIFREGNRGVAVALPAACYAQWEERQRSMHGKSDPVAAAP
jgi:ribosomal peptide maturation radical SAM protein 1